MPWWKLDAFGLCVVVGFVVAAVALSILSVQWGWFSGWWELALWLGLGGACLVGAALQVEAPKQGIALSIWATRRHVDAYNIGETANAETADQGLYLGSFAGEGEPLRLRYKGEKHLLVFGPPGSSKSMGLAVPNIALLPRSMIVIDPKGQLAAITERSRAELGRTIVLNPFGVFADQWPHMESAGWNPLLQLDPKSHDFAGDAVCIADALIDRAAGGGGNSVFFENSAENLLTALIMWECFTKSGKPGLPVIWQQYMRTDKPSLRAIREELGRPTLYDQKKQPVSGLLHTLKCMAECDNYAIRTTGGRLYSRLTDENSKATSVQDVIETVLSGTRFLDDPRIGYDMAHGGAIDFGALHHEMTTIYLILPVHELQAQAKWLRMFVSLALRGLYKNPPTSGATLPPVLFILDEFANLGRLQEIIKALGAARDYSIQLFMVLQSLSQLKAHYEKEWPLFFAGSGAVAAFASRDFETAEQLSKLCGNREERVQTETNSGGTVTPQSIPLARPEDLMRLERGQTVNFIEPCPWPVVARAPVYAQLDFCEDLAPNPYYRG